MRASKAAAKEEQLLQQTLSDSEKIGHEQKVAREQWVRTGVAVAVAVFLFPPPPCVPTPAPAPALPPSLPMPTLNCLPVVCV